MDVNFHNALGFILAPDNDGSYADNSAGEQFDTHYGITFPTWQDAVSRKVVVGDFAKISYAQVRAIYYALYWRACECHMLPRGVDIMVFNDAVLCGVGAASRLLQRIVSATPDGQIGPRTLEAVAKYVGKNGVSGLLRAIHDADIAFCADMANASNFIRGWSRRDNECLQLAITTSSQGTLL